MQHRWRAALGPLTLVPLVWALVCAIGAVRWWTHPPFDPDLVLDGDGAARIASQSLDLLATGTIVAAVTTLLLVSGMILHAASSPRVPDDQRGMWCVVLILGCGLTMPAYWWFAVRRARPVAPAAALT